MESSFFSGISPLRGETGGKYAFASGGLAFASRGSLAHARHHLLLDREALTAKYVLASNGTEQAQSKVRKIYVI